MLDHQVKVEKLIRQACDRETVDLVLLPELSAIEYSTYAFDNLTELATETDGWLVKSMSNLARNIKVAICFGMPRRGSNFHGYYISQIIIDRDGSVTGHYDKLHVAQFGASAEKPYFTPGDHVTVFEVSGFRIGIVVCYDMRFGDYISKLVREYKLDAMLHSVAFSQDGSFVSWRSFICTLALENQIYWLSVNRAGVNWGHSVICPPWFERNEEVVDFDESETLAIITLDKSILQQVRDKYPLSHNRFDDYTNVVRADE